MLMGWRGGGGGSTHIWSPFCCRSTRRPSGVRRAEDRKIPTSTRTVLLVSFVFIGLLGLGLLKIRSLEGVLAWVSRHFFGSFVQACTALSAPLMLSSTLWKQ